MHFVDERGNSLINDEHKLRIPLSERALIILAEDMDVFRVSKAATFINTIFCNFWEEAKASRTTYLQRKEQEFISTLQDTSLDDSARQLVVEQLLKEEDRIARQGTQQYTHLKTISKLYHLSQDTIYILENICHEHKTYSRPAEYIRYVIEEYCTLPFIERERIFHKPIYELIETACTQHRALTIVVPNNGKNESYDVYPYKIVPDTFHTQSYLVCYSRLKTEDESARIVASFSMTRLPMPTLHKKTFHLNEKERAHIEKCITNYSPAYLVGKVEQIHVKLTEKGKHSFRSRLYSRPEKVASLSSADVYVFECTQQQIFNYFFSFGAEAEILSPPGLRARFAHTYQKAHAVYADDNTPHD